MAAEGKVDGKVVIDLSVVGSECANATLNAFTKELGKMLANAQALNVELDCLAAKMKDIGKTKDGEAALRRVVRGSPLYK